MSFPIIGQEAVWDNWGSRGQGAWRMWFMAPYGSWIYSSYVKDGVITFIQVYTGEETYDYDIVSWTFEDAVNGPDTLFPNETASGYPDGGMNCGVIRGDTPYLYLIGRENAAPDPDTVLRRFDVSDNFSEVANYTILNRGVGGDPVELEHIAGIEVKPGSDPEDGIFLVTNNRGAQPFELHRYDDDGAWDDLAHDPTVTIDLVDDGYIENNTLARIRGIATAEDGNILLFINTGEAALTCRVLKFDAETLGYLGSTSWEPGIQASKWGSVIKAATVFMFFRELDSVDYFDRTSAIYYDRATGIPDPNRSNFILPDNLTSFGSEEVLTLRYEAKDAFNLPVINTPTEFVIHGEDPDDPDSWNNRVAGIQDSDLAEFFDPDTGIPHAISATVDTDANGVAIAYYKAMRTGTGTEIDAVDVYCPASV